MADYTEILYEKRGAAGLITLNRPQVMNAISPTTQHEMSAALDEAVADPEVRAVIITGAGRAFSSGMDQGPKPGRRRDLDWPYGVPSGQSASDWIDSWRGREGNEFLRLWELDKPVIGAINGWAMGAGSWLALCTHITIASEQAVFAQPEVRHGSNTSFLWTMLAGVKNSLRYGLVGDHIDAQEALRIGLVIKVVPHEQLLDECFELVERIALVPPETVKINLAIATQGLEMMGLHKAWLLNAELSAMARLSKREEFNKRLEDARKQGGLRAFFEARDKPFRPEPFGPFAKGQ